MRVVGGTARGRRLRAPPGGAVRPTADRVREAVFNMVRSRRAVEGVDVVDLFAGTGALEATTDGFELAEVDLEVRGEGTILGTRQKGRTDLKLASLRRDKDLVAQARDVAFAIVDDDPGLGAHPELAAEVRSLVEEEEAEFLFKS